MQATAVPVQREIQSSSTELVRVGVIVKKSGKLFDPTSDPVAFAYTLAADPNAGDWIAASWETGGPPFVTASLVGPANGGIVLPVNTYLVWIRITDNPEVPVLRAGTLRIY